MKAFLFSDLHTSYKYLARFEEFIDARKDIKLIIFGGDFLNSGASLEFANYFVGRIKKIGLSFLWIPGNNDVGQGYDLLCEAYPSLENRVVEFGGRRFTGAAGSPHLWAGVAGEREPIIDAELVAGSIFITHYPPPGAFNYVLKESELSPAPPLAENPKFQIPNSKTIENCKLSASWRIENSAKRLAHSPLLHICGHLHTRYGLANLGETKVVKLGAAAFGHCATLDLESLKVELFKLN